MSSPSKIAKLLVQAVDSVGNIGQSVACESFWRDQRCVIIFFRRFGWEFCRLAAKELSTDVKPLLDANNVRFIGVGFDSRFVKPFVEGGFFKGELYVDSEKKCYEALQYQTFSYLTLLRQLVSKAWREAHSRASTLGISSDLKGDGFQNGGALVIDKGGKTLLEYKQEDASDHVASEAILKALNIPVPKELGAKKE